jgi:hypothetical protein
MSCTHTTYTYEGARRPWRRSCAAHTRARVVLCVCVRACVLCGIDDDACDGRRAEDDDEDEVFIVDFIGMDCTGIDCFIFSGFARTSTTTGCDARCASRCA